MKILHTMIRVNDLEESIRFYCDVLGMRLLRKKDYPSGRFTLAFVGYAPEAEASVIELTYNWDTHKYDLGNAFGHIALGVEDIYKTCEALRAKGAKIVREPGPMKHGSTAPSARPSAPSSGRGAQAEGSSPPSGGSEIAFIEDPNGYKIELIDLGKRAQA